MSRPASQADIRLRDAAADLRLVEAVQTRGVVRRVGDGVAEVSGLESVCYEELLRFDSGAYGLAFDLRHDAIGVVLLSDASTVREGDGVEGLSALPSLPVGPSALGRVLSPLGDPLDDGPPLPSDTVLPLFRPAPEIIQRQSVTQTYWSGVTAIDTAIPIGRGQRELIIGDRNVGKTALAIDLVASQQAGDMACVYVLIGQPMTRVRALQEVLEQVDAMKNTVIIAAYASDSPGLQFLAPWAGASMAESFRDSGRHAVVVYDDLTKHADVYREIALLLDRPPGREAYPGDIFYIHAELLERAAALSEELGGGSVTAFPIVETTDGDISAYIPTNLISITDGQIYLDTHRFERDQRPAIDIGRSVSRIGAVAQPPVIRHVAKNLKIQLSRFESLEKLSRVGLDMDVDTRAALNTGKQARALLRQSRFTPRDIAHQVIALTAVTQRWLAGVDAAEVGLRVEKMVSLARIHAAEIVQALNQGDLPGGDWQAKLGGILTAQGAITPAQRDSPVAKAEP